MTELTTSLANKKPINRKPFLVTIKAIKDVTTKLRCITFYSPNLQNYPVQSLATHLKIFLPQAGQSQPDLPDFGEKGPIWSGNIIKPVIRTYTVRRLRPQLGEIDIEFVLHGAHGNAAKFAANAQIGQIIGISFPGNPYPVSISTQHVLAGDSSALPAIAAILEAMPAHYQGHVFIQINNASAKIKFSKPDQVAIHWFIGEREIQTQQLITQFKQIVLPLPEGYFWLAGENNLVIALRGYLKKECGCSREQIYAIPYWRNGFNEDQYHQQRHQVMDQE